MPGSEAQLAICLQVRAENCEGLSPWSKAAHSAQLLLPALPPSNVAAELCDPQTGSSRCAGQAAPLLTLHGPACACSLIPPGSRPARWQVLARGGRQA